MRRKSSESGLTFVELLAALVVGAIVVVPLVLMVQEMGRAWRSVTVRESLNAAVMLADDTLQQRLQNFQDVSYDTSSGSGSQAILGHDMSGDVIRISVQGTGGLAAIVIQDVTTGSTVTLQPPNVSYAGTSFAVNGRVVTCTIRAVSTVDASQQIQEPATFVIRGGV